MNPVFTALSSGHSPENILKYLSSLTPILGKKIKHAQSLGHSSLNILKYMSDDLDDYGKDEFTSPGREQVKQEKKKSVAGQQLYKTGAKIGSAALGYGLIANGIKTSLHLPLLDQVTKLFSEKGPLEDGVELSVGESIEKEMPTDDKMVNLENPIEKFGLAKLAQNLISSGNESEKLPTILEAMMDPKQKKEYLKGVEKGTSDTFENSLKNLLTTDNQENIEEIKEESLNPIELPTIKDKSFSKGEIVSTDSGQEGNIKSQSGNNFLVEIDGKLKQVPFSELRGQPEAIKKSKVVFDPSTVPENLKSSALAMALPLPDKSGIINMFHNGEVYLYKRKDGKPISDDIISRVVEGFDMPLTSGETFMGAWDTDVGDSRGSASFKELVKLAQRVGEPDDPEKPLHFHQLDNKFIHGYIKEFMQILKEVNKNFVAKKKKK